MLIDKIKSTAGAISASGKKQLESMAVTADSLRKWAEKAPDTIHEYASRFDADEMWQKIEKWGVKAGQDLVIMVLAMYYTIRKFIPAINEKFTKK
ncbi:MAG: hypothetical protein NC187_04725 [Candidatus Amulumruptor caecigallinarius]|nr:hypothetical protein [Candidatus Amulumruptor caecigallinarius]MCM1396776.1 hypothetical protein [Candidatus Amulumruptor caecigallinarius]MCM1454529.1 hypothetical protein [bacterium]